MQDATSRLGTDKEVEREDAARVVVAEVLSGGLDAAARPAARMGRGSREGGSWGSGAGGHGLTGLAGRGFTGVTASRALLGQGTCGGISPKKHLLRDFFNFSSQHTFNPKKSPLSDCLAPKVSKTFAKVPQTKQDLKFLCNGAAGS